MSTLAIGIDLGTSTSEIAVFRHGEPEAIPDPGTKIPIIPSLIAMNTRGKLLVGEEARAFVDKPSHGIREIKRLMGTSEAVALDGNPYRPEELSALILTKLKHNAEIALGEPVDKVVLSVPANFNDAAKRATLNAAEIAGLEVLHLINEPTAAALAFGIKNIDAEAQLVVFDFGGGTLDVSVLEMLEGVLEVKSSFGDPKLGGKDFDDALMELILRKFHALHGELPISEQSRGKLKGEAEKTKIALTTQPSTVVHIEYFANKGIEIIDLEVEVTREEFETDVFPLLEKARQCVTTALKNGKLRPSAIDRVLLVGGTTYIPCVRQMVEEVFGTQVKAEVNPDLAVVLGAATLAGMKQGLVDARESLVFSDICPMGLGIDVVTEIGGQEVLTYQALIKPNTPVPYSSTHPFSLQHANQRAVTVRIFQTHIDFDLFPLAIGLSKQLIEDTGMQGHLTDIPLPVAGEPHPIEVEFSYDDNGLVKLHGSIPGLQKRLDVAFAHSKFRMSPEELNDGRQRVRELLASSGLLIGDDHLRKVPEKAGAVNAESRWQDHPQARRFSPLLAKADRLIEAMPQHKSTLTDAAAALKQALTGNDERTIERAGDTLTDLLFDIENG